MKYDFNKFTERRGTNCYKWDTIGENELPMWVADMDFPAAEPIRNAIKKRLDHGIFGYSIIPDEWYDAYILWWGSRHGLKIEREELIFSAGVIPTISTAVRKFTSPAEKIVIQTPVYNIFYNSILNNGRVVLESPLKYENGAYSMDFDDLEKKFSDPMTTMMILCNPQNPSGNIWTREELSKIGALAKKYGVIVVSDEVHCDITEPGLSYVPFLSAGDDCRDVGISCIAPTKAFNIAGIQTSAAHVCNKNIRDRLSRALNTDEVAEPNIFAVDAAVAAFTECGDWLDEMRAHVFKNKERVISFISAEKLDLTVVSSHATYLLWIDCSKIFCDDISPAKYIRAESGLFVADGAQYGECGKKFIRVNLACTEKTLDDGLQRLKAAIDKYQKK